jgi:hypothetical protein
MGNSNKHADTQLLEQSLYPWLLSYGSRQFEDLPDEVIELVATSLPIAAFLGLRGACRRLHNLVSQLAVEQAPLCCLTSAGRRMPGFIDDVHKYIRDLSFSWELRETKVLFFPTRVLFHLFRTGPTSAASDDRVRGIFIHAYEVGLLDMPDFGKDLRPIFPIFSLIAAFKNLKILALSQFEVDENVVAQLGHLQLHTLFLTANSVEHHRAMYDFRQFKSLRKLHFASIVPDCCGYEINLPPHLRELEVVIPDNSGSGWCNVDANLSKTLTSV